MNNHQFEIKMKEQEKRFKLLGFKVLVGPGAQNFLQNKRLEAEKHQRLTGGDSKSAEVERTEWAESQLQQVKQHRWRWAWQADRETAEGEKGSKQLCSLLLTM